MRILQINTADAGGGAEGTAFNLLRAYRTAGHESWLAVGHKYTQDQGVFEIPRPSPPGLRGHLFHAAAQAFRSLEGHLPGARRAARACDRLASPQRLADWRAGRDEHDFPGSHQILNILPSRPDIIHCHNLHGWYFDLDALPELSRQAPLILNLRDAWLLTGHCAHFFSCERWKSGCGNCPSLDVYPAVRRDSTEQNWNGKQHVFAQCRLFVTAPSQWLLDQARQVIPAQEYRVVPNGIRTDVFAPGDKAAVRRKLGLPLDVPVLMFAAASTNNLFKDPVATTACLKRLMTLCPSLHFLCVGSDVRVGDARLHVLPYVKSAEKMAQCYRAADVFLHAARAEAFGKTITEAMACGTPVVATATGGIPEQMLDGETGFLAPTGDADALAERVQQLLALPAEAQARFSAAAAARGAQFPLERQARSFLDWYAELLAK